jgi:hypothetical protein
VNTIGVGQLVKMPEERLWAVHRPKSQGRLGFYGAGR